VGELAIVFDPRAAVDVETAADWYEEQTPGLGLEFLVALDAVLDRVTHQPDVYQQVTEKTRRALLARFPFAVYYRATRTRITVLAVLHTRRRPSAWKDRT
jgi:plasmid stabilization system protein ParE